LGNFQATEGHYVLDVNISRDGSRFNSFHPHLVMLENTGLEQATAYQRVPFFCAFAVLILLGAGLLVHSALSRRQETRNSLLTACPPTPAALRLPQATRRRFATDYLLGDRRSSARYPLSGLSPLSLVIVLAVAPLCVSMYLVLPPTPIGLRIHLLPPNYNFQPAPGLQPLLVHVELSDSLEPRLYVEHEPVPWHSLNAALRHELKSRPPNWPVYLECDPDLEWNWPVKAIDEIRGLGAEVVLLTTRRHRGESMQTSR
jgi:hypothetical protein